MDFGLHAGHTTADTSRAIASDRRRLMLYDVRTHKQTELARGEVGFPNWSQDDRFVYFDTQAADAALFRVDIRSRKLERMVSLKNVFRTFGVFGPWIGLAPDDWILIERDAAASEIYALDFDAP